MPEKVLYRTAATATGGGRDGKTALDDGSKSIDLVVPKELGGQGVGGTLVKHILDYAAAQGLKVRPDCPFVKAYIDKHPDYQANSLAHGAKVAP